MILLNSTRLSVARFADTTPCQAIHEFLQDHLHPVFSGLVSDSVGARHELSYSGGRTDRYMTVAYLDNPEVHALWRLNGMPASWKQVRFMNNIIGDEDCFSINCRLCFRCEEEGSISAAMTHRDSLYDAVETLRHLRLRSREVRYGCCEGMGMFLSWRHKVVENGMK